MATDKCITETATDTDTLALLLEIKKNKNNKMSITMVFPSTKKTFRFYPEMDLMTSSSLLYSLFLALHS